MKIVYFAFAVILFSSCAKPNLNFGGGVDGWANITFPEDTTNKLKADINNGGNISHFAAKGFGTSYTKYIMTLIDSSIVTIYASDTTFKLEIKLINILAPGTYNFGLNPGRGKEVKVTCYVGNTVFTNDANTPSGTIKIDVFTSSKIEGSFSGTCRNGTQSVVISNGSFTGTLR